MGRVAIIIVLGLTITLGFYRNILTSRTTETVENASGYYNHITAKNIAHSAINNYLKKLYQNKTLRGTFTEQNIYEDGGVDTVTISSNSATPTNGDTVSVYAVAYFGGEKCEIEANLLVSNFAIAPITSGLAFPGPNPVLDIFGNPLISGHNHNMSGVPSASCPDRPGIAVASITDSVNMVNNLINDGKTNSVIGSGTNPSVDVEPTIDPSNFLDPIIANCDYYLPPGTYSAVQYGTEANPVIVYGQGIFKFSGGVIGYGILIIDGIMTLSGNFFWYGPVYVIGSSAEIFNSVGTNRITGGVVLGGSGVVAKMKGNADILYSCETLNNVINNCASLQTFNVLSWYE